METPPENISVWDLLHNNRSIREFWDEWLHTSNPWRAAWNDGDDFVETRIVYLLIFFLVLHTSMLSLKKMGVLNDVLASRPTLIANQLHCTTVSVLAVYLLLTTNEQEPNPYLMWQEVGIPLSVAYFMADFIWYVIPGKYSPFSSSNSWDFLIGFHHIVMIMCHYPVASNQGAELCGAGSSLWAIRLSLLGYLCELSNPLMNYRWYLMQTLKAHRFDFSLTVVVLVTSFAARVVLLGYLISNIILPMAAVFIEAKQVFIYTMCVLGHAVIMLLSLYWLHVLTKPGVKRMLVFSPPKNKGKKGAFTFGTDMGRAEKKDKEN
jgi:hypothetical protein